MNKEKATAILNSMTMKNLEKYVRTIAQQHGDQLKDPNRNYSKPIKPKLIDYAITHYENAIIENLSNEAKEIGIKDIRFEKEKITTEEKDDHRLLPKITPNAKTVETDITDPFNGFKVWIQNQIKDIATNSVNENKVLDIANMAIFKALQNQPKEKIVINKRKETEVEIKTAHKIFPKLLKMATAKDVNVALVGKAGAGKTHIAKQVSEALKMDFTSVSLTSGTSEGQLTGWLLPIEKNGQFTFVASQFLKLYEKGNAVILLDEMDAADPNMMLIINTALANGGFHCPQRHENPYVKRGENVIIIGAMNTYGNGADLQYCGRNEMDVATLDRFVLLEMDYDKDLETKLIPNEPLKQWGEKIRKNITKNKLERILSTRKLKALNSLMNEADFTMKDIENHYFMGWSADEKSKALAY